MKQLKIEKDIWYWGKQSPSKSFLKKLSQALTQEISCLINSAELKNAFTSVVDLTFEKDGPKYNPLRPFEILMSIEDKNQPLVLSRFIVIWKPKDYEEETLVYPWSDVSEIDIDFEMKISNDDIRHLNYLLPLLYTPIIASIDSGLPYDYQIKCQTTDGTLLFYCNETFEDRNIKELYSTIQGFVKNYNDNNETKIHYIGDARILKNNRICVDMDFGSCAKEAIKECMYAFKKFSFIKKIVYR